MMKNLIKLAVIISTIFTPITTIAHAVIFNGEKMLIANHKFEVFAHSHLRYVGDNIIEPYYIPRAAVRLNLRPLTSSSNKLINIVLNTNIRISRYYEESVIPPYYPLFENRELAMNYASKSIEPLMKVVRDSYANILEVRTVNNKLKCFKETLVVNIRGKGPRFIGEIGKDTAIMKNVANCY